MRASSIGISTTRTGALAARPILTQKHHSAPALELSRYLHLPTLMLAARDLFELASVLFEAPQIAAFLRVAAPRFLQARHASPRQPRAQRRPALRTARP